ncbi:MAG: HprK-related kinase B [Candidatus Omnitrophota bacterium]
MRGPKPSARFLLEQRLILQSDTITFQLNFDGCIIEVRTNDRCLAEQLQNYFALFQDRQHQAHYVVHAVQQPEWDPGLVFEERPREVPGKKIKEAVCDLSDGRAVRKIQTGMIMVMTGNRNAVVGPCRQNINQVINFINNRYIEWRLNQGAVLLHCAGVLLRGKGAALCGFSGAGKSTLALHLMNEGAKFVSNDRIAAARQNDRVRMYGAAKQPRVNPGTIVHNRSLWHLIPKQRRHELQGLTPSELWALEEKYDVDILRLYGQDSWRLHCAMDRLVVLNWQRGAGSTKITEVDLSARRDLYPAFMKGPGVFFRPGCDDFYDTYCTAEAYRKCLEGVPVYEVTGGVDFHHLCRELKTLL